MSDKMTAEQALEMLADMAHMEEEEYAKAGGGGRVESLHATILQALSAPAVQGEPTDDELLNWAAEEQLFLLCEEDDFLQIAREVLHKYGSRSPAVQGKPVAALLIGEPEYTKQGWEPGDWDIEPNATTIEAFAKLAKPGAYQLYLALQPGVPETLTQEQQP